MMLFEFDIAQYRWLATSKVAELLGIPGWDWNSCPELLDEIATRRPSASDKLQALLGDYEAWRSFHADVETKRQHGQLPPDRQQELIRLAGALQRSRNALSEEVNR